MFNNQCKYLAGKEINSKKDINGEKHKKSTAGIGRVALYLPKGIAKKIYLIITIVVTIPMLLFFYFDALRLKELLLEKRIYQLIQVASLLEDKLPNSFDSILRSENATKLTKKEQVIILNRYLQPIVNQVAAAYPGYGVGFYYRKLDCIVAVGPQFKPSLLGKSTNNLPKLRLYETGRFQTGYVQGFTWGGKPTIIALDYPIYYNGQLIGHSWANKKTEDIQREFYLTLLQRMFFTSLVWLVVSAIIWWLFKKLESNLSILSAQIFQDQDSLGGFKDFPELLPVLQTVTSLRQQLKEEAAQSRNEAQRMKQLIDLCPMLIAVIDSDEKILMLNQAFLELNKNLSKEDLIGKPYRVLINAVEIDYENTTIIRALRRESTIKEHRKYLNKEWLHLAAPIKNSETGQIIGAIGLYHDISEHENLRKEMHKLDRLNLIGEMAAGVAHEIRNPMTAAKGYLQLLMGRLGEDSHKYLTIVIEELDRANSIISDFLSLARSKPSDAKEQSLNDIIMSISPLIQGEALKRGIVLELELARSIPELYLNDKEIKQLILNLCRNSIDSMPERGHLTIKTSQEFAGVQLLVRDTGCGIPKHQLDKIFDPFYTTKDNGTGLGLAICLGIVSRHHGQINVESEEGRGTSFIITFASSALNSKVS